MLSRVVSKKVNNMRVAGIMAAQSKANFHSSKPLNEIVSKYIILYLIADCD